MVDNILRIKGEVRGDVVDSCSIEIAKGVTVRGNVTSTEGSIINNGTIRQNAIASDGSITNNGTIRRDVTALDIINNGTIRGNIITLGVNSTQNKIDSNKNKKNQTATSDTITQTSNSPIISGLNVEGNFIFSGGSTTIQNGSSKLSTDGNITNKNNCDPVITNATFINMQSDNAILQIVGNNLSLEDGIIKGGTVKFNGRTIQAGDKGVDLNQFKDFSQGR